MGGRKGRFLALALAAGLLAPRVSAAPGFAPDSADGTGERSVVVLLFDGFAPAMVEAYPTPALDRMREEGAWTHNFVPPFPTISLIGGITISTGCWPERHGVVTNKFLDPKRGFYDHSRDADWLTGCEHLHQVAERQGVRSAALGWYGATSESRGPLASIVSEPSDSDERPQDAERARQVVELLERPPEERPRLILAYFHGPDLVAHLHGMDSQRTRFAVIQADAALGAVLAAIQSLPDRERVTLIVTTDHGMRAADRVVNIKRILGRHDIEATALSTGTTSFLYFEDASGVEEAAQKLAAYDEFEVIRPDAPPAYFHLGRGPRVGQLIVSARPPYFIEDTDLWPAWVRWIAPIGPEFIWAGFALKATHGYPPDTPGVQGILYAWGSGVATGRAVGAVRAIDLHPTVAHLLGIAPGEPVDGEVAASLVDGVYTAERDE